MDAKELLDKRWPGAEAALLKLIADMDKQVNSPWLAVRAEVEGPQKFSEQMANSLKEGLLKMDHEPLADLAAQALAPIILKLVVEIAQKRQKGGEHADDR